MWLCETSFLEERVPDALLEDEFCELGEMTSMSGTSLAGGSVELANAESKDLTFEVSTAAQLARVKGWFSQPLHLNGWYRK
jgi:hypothetical protein